jgi:hypothetical protein
MFDGVALAATLMFLVVKAAHRKSTGKPTLRFDDAVSAAQLYAAIVTIRATPVTPLPEFGKEEVVPP